MREIVVISLLYNAKHNLNLILCAADCGISLKPPRELKKIFDEDTGSIYFDLTDMTRLMILADSWISTMRNRLF